MNIKSFKRGSSSDPDINQVDNRVLEYTSQLTTNPMLVGQLITGIDVSTTAVNVPHSLGKPFVGWLVIRKVGNLNIYEASVQSQTSLFIKLVSTATGTIDIWIF